MFLLYYPLKQGLKQKKRASTPPDAGLVFTLLSIKTRIETAQRHVTEKVTGKFLLYYPLKQGLKHVIFFSLKLKLSVFTLLSIKTRIETLRD